MVKWSIPAREDLRRIHDHISQDSKYYAKKVTSDIVEQSRSLNRFPSRGRIVPEMNDPNVRELFVYSYRLVYQTSVRGVEVLAVIHGSRDFSSGNLDVLRE